jgi:hypothetical protein
MELSRSPAKTAETSSSPQSIKLAKLVSQHGAKTAYAQQWHILRRNGEANPDPRKSFKIDLDAFLAPHHAVGTELLIMGDFNETVGESPKASTHS